MSERAKFRKNLLSFLAFTSVAVVWALFLFAQGGALPSLPGENDPYEVSVLLPTSSSLAPGARVTMAGVQVGDVEQVERQGLGTRADLVIDEPDVTPLLEDARVRLRQRTPIGENYISITPGKVEQTEETIPSGGTIPIEQSEEYVDVDQILSVLRGGTREHARETIEGMGGALVRRGDELNALVGHANDAAAAGGRLVEVAHRDRVAAGRLVKQLGDVAASVGDRGTAIQTIARRGLVGLGAIRRRDAALASALKEAPETLDRVRSTVGVVGSFSDRATPVVADVAAAVRELRPAVRRLPEGTGAGRGVLTELGRAAPGLRRTLVSLTDLSKALPPVLPPVRNVLCDVDPMVRYAAPYSNEAMHILMGLSSSSNSYDATGHLIRLAPILNENSSAGQPDVSTEARQMLLRSGLFGSVNGLNYDGYPKPGSLGTTGADSEFPIGPDEVPEAGYEYPRVKADC